VTSKHIVSGIMSVNVPRLGTTLLDDERSAVKQAQTILVL
jgi:hypothetical protein